MDFVDFTGMYQHKQFSELNINEYFFIIEEKLLRKYQKKSVDHATTVDTGMTKTREFNLYEEVWTLRLPTFVLNY